MDLSKNQNYIDYQNSLSQINEQKQILYNNYGSLNKNNREIKTLMREFETLNSAYRDRSEFVTYNYYNYIVLFFVSVLLLLLFFKYSGNQTGGGGNGFHLDKLKNGATYFIYLFFIFFLYLYYSLFY